MTFNIITRYSSNTYQASAGKLKASCTAGHEQAAQAIIPKVIAHVIFFGKMEHPVVSEFERRSDGDSAGTKAWRLVLEENPNQVVS